MLGFEIGQRESGFYSDQTDGITEPSSTVLLYRYALKNKCLQRKYLLQIRQDFDFEIYYEKCEPITEA